MSQTFDIAVQFDEFCANGERASEFQSTTIEPLISSGEEIVFDFIGVRNMNSSFCNALVANLIARHGKLLLDKMHFVNCNETVKIHLRSAFTIGLSRFEEKKSCPQD